MLLRATSLVMFIVTASTVLGQLRLQVTPCRVRIVVVDRTSQHGIENVTVQLMDAVGSSSAQSERNTDSAGQAEFQSWTGTHRVRIYGPQIHEYNGDFDISQSESFHLERIYVVRKEENLTVIPASTITVPAVRLKIPDNARKEFERGSKAMEAQKWGESRKHFQAAVDLYPDYDLAYNGLGVACSQLNDTPAARRAFLKATELNDKFAGAQRNLARILLSERNYQEVALLLNRSLDAEPMNAWALTNAAYAELQLRRFKDAAEHALRVHGLPHDGLANAHVIAGYALEALGRQREAAEQWGLYLKEDPKGPNAKYAQESIARLIKSPLS
jgi:tetratricopeptide (TPR) repeat protein